MNMSQHILIVDDDSGIRDLLGQFLGRHRFKRVWQKNAEEIRVLLKKHSVDLIILDIMMPGGE